MHDNAMPSNIHEQRRNALSTWDGEGGAGPLGPQDEPAYHSSERDAPPLTNVELVSLRVRVVALENLVIALLSGASDEQNQRALEMADAIAHGPGKLAHPLTRRSSARMIAIVERARHFRS